MLSDLLSHGHDLRILPVQTLPLPLHCTVVGAGYEQRMNEVYSWDGTKRGSEPFVVIQHTVLGEGRLEYAGAYYRLTPGQTMLVTAPHPHRYYLDRGGRWEYFWLVVNGREALRIAREILDVSGPVLRPTSDVADRLASACLSVLTGRITTAGQASTIAYAAMAALHDIAFGNSADGRPALPAALSRVMAFVADNMAAPLTIDRLAAVAGMSRAHFVRQFTLHAGLPPSDYVEQHRLERIERLLLATEMTVAEIAKATGYADGNYLAKVFRRSRGLSPLAFRATRAEAG